MAWDEGNFLSALLGQANSMEPSFMRPPAPRPMGGMPMGGTQPGSMGGPSLADIERQAGVPAPRKRASVVDILGGLFDTAAELGGVNPQYQPTLDARLQREREAELYPLEVQKARLGNQKTQMDIQSGQNKVLGQAASYIQRAYQNGGAQGALNMFDAIAPRIGMTPEQIQGERAQLGANPEGYIGALSVFTGGKTYEVGDSLVRDNGDGTTKVIYSGQTKKKEPYRYITMDGDQGPGIYVFQDNVNLGKQGGVVRAPAQPRAPDAYDRKVEALRRAGVPENQIPAIASGVMDSPLKPKGGSGGNSKYAQDEKRRTDAYRDTVNQIDRLSKSGLLDYYSGLDYGFTKLAQPIAGLAGYTTGQQTRTLEAELAQFQQSMRRAINPESNYESKQLWERLEPLFPKLGLGKSGADIRKDLGIMKNLLDEFMRGRQEGAPSETAPPPSLEDARRAVQGGGAKPAVTNDAEYEALPSGTLFVDPNGVERRKP